MDAAKIKAIAKFYKTTLPSDMIFAQADISTSNEQVEKLTREFNIRYRAFISSLIYLLSTRVDLSFAVHKLAKFSSNPVKVHFEGLVHLLRYIRDNKTFGLKYYRDINDAPLSDLLRHASIKNENQFMAFSGISIESYIILYQGGTIDYVTHVPGPVAQSNSESEYNAACTAGMALAHFRVLIHEFLNNDPYIVPEDSPLVILDSKPAMCMAKYSKDTKHTRHIARRIYFVSNGEKCRFHKIDWCEGGL